MQVVFVAFLAFVIVSIIGDGNFETGLYRIFITIATIIGIAIFALIVYHWEKFARLYYSLTPHPAKRMVDAAIHQRTELDGKALADILRPVPGGRIEQEVRAEQARRLAAKAYSYAESMRAEAERIKAKALREAEFIQAQDDLANAATAHEKAKARLEALRKRVG